MNSITSNNGAVQVAAIEAGKGLNSSEGTQQPMWKTISHAAVSACVGRYAINNIFSTAGRFQTGMPFKTALDMRLCTAFSQTGTALSYVVTTYAADKGLRSVLGVKEDGSAASTGIYCGAAALGVIASHPFTAPFYMIAAQQYKERTSAKGLGVMREIWANHRAPFLKAIPARALCAGSEFGLYLSIKSLLGEHQDKTGITNRASIEAISTGISQVPCILAHQLYVHTLNTLSKTNASQEKHSNLTALKNVTAKPKNWINPRYAAAFTAFYLASSLKVSLIDNVKRELDSINP